MKTAAIQARIDALHDLLRHRNSSLSIHSREIEQASHTGGPDALVDAVQRRLAASVHPDSLTGAYAAIFRPEARELLIECELPRQDVVLRSPPTGSRRPRVSYSPSLGRKLRSRSCTNRF